MTESDSGIKLDDAITRKIAQAIRDEKSKCKDSSNDKKCIIYIHESSLESIFSDCFSFCMAIALISVGVLLRSAVMQWVGAIMFFLILSAKGSGKLKRLTPQDAADKLKTDFGVQAGGNK